MRTGLWAACVAALVGAARFGAGRGSHRIRREGTLPFELGYARPATVRVG